MDDSTWIAVGFSIIALAIAYPATVYGIRMWRNRQRVAQAVRVFWRRRREWPVGGVVSLVLALVAGTCLGSLLFSLAGQSRSLPGAVQRVSCVGFVCAVMGVSVGIAGTTEGNKSKRVAVLGIVLNATVLLGFAGALVIGIVRELGASG
jgi:hypothetical protein